MKFGVIDPGKLPTFSLNSGDRSFSTESYSPVDLNIEGWKQAALCSVTAVPRRPEHKVSADGAPGLGLSTLEVWSCLTHFSFAPGVLDWWHLCRSIYPEITRGPQP